MPGPFPYRDGFGSTQAPACDITISWQGKSKILPALIDSGASGTLIPDSLAAELSLRKIREKRVSGWDKRVESRSEYVANINFLGFMFPNQPVVGAARDYVLIGRDILNRYTTTLNGRQLEFSVT